MAEAETAFGIQDSPFTKDDDSCCVDELGSANAPAFSVSQITLSNFRNYRDVRLICDATPVILVGSNGSGKTNLLEAVSLLVPGRGLRRSPLTNLQKNDVSEPWAVAVQLQTETGILAIGTGRDPALSTKGEDDGERRLVHINGKPVRGQNALAEHVAMAWITPDMDRLLVESASARRKFLDRLVYSFDPAHGTRVQRYEKAMRERLRLLREPYADAAWLAALEHEMAQTAVAIAAARRYMIECLRAAIADSGDAFPHAVIEVRGTAEDLLARQPALLVEDFLRAAFAKARGEDAVSGTCAVGAHRSDLAVMHQEKNCPVGLCSTGEQKSLLICLMLAYVRLLIDARHMKPLFLLDDIAAHLDDFRRTALFEELRSLGVQAWLTGTEAESFNALIPYAQMVRVEGGTLS